MGRYLNSCIIEYAFRRALRQQAERVSAHLIEQIAYDVVFDEQRAAVSRRRQAALRGANLRAEIIGRLTGPRLPACDQREAEVDAAIGAGTMRELARRVTVTVIDKQWREHIRAMGRAGPRAGRGCLPARGSQGLRGHAGQDRRGNHRISVQPEGRKSLISFV